MRSCGVITGRSWWVLLCPVWVGIWAGEISAQQWQTYTTADGLAGDFVWSIYQSSDGAMWFGTGGHGVSRYDGTWQTFTVGLPGDGVATIINAIFQSTDGVMWFGAGGYDLSGGVSRYDGERWQTFTTADGLVANDVRSIYQSTDGVMWFGTDSGVSRYDGERWQTLTTADGLADNFVWSIYQSPDGALWFGTSGGGVSRYDGTWQTFTTADGLVADDEVRAIYQSSDGVLWFGTLGGVSRYDGREWQTFTIADGLAGNSVQGIYQAADGALWFGSFGGGVSRYDGERWQTFTTADGLAYDLIGSMFRSSDGALWFGTSGAGVSRYDGAWQRYSNLSNVIFQSSDGAIWFEGEGVSRYDGENWQTFATADDLANYSILDTFQSSDGTIWFGAYWGGVGRYDGERWQTFTTADGLAGNRVNTIFQSADGVMWFGTDGGTSQYDGEKWQTFTTPDSPDGNPWSLIFQSADGALWFGTYGGGMGRYDGERWKTFTASDGLANDSVWSIFQSLDGTLWVGSFGEGVSRYDGERWQTFTTADGLADNFVDVIFQSADGAMWFGTSGGGVSRYDGENWQTFTTQEGLVDNAVLSVFQSSDGAMWFGTSGGGVSRYDGERWQTFTAADGLAGNSVDDIVQSSDGAMWFGTDRGVSRYDGESWQTFTTADGLANNIVYDIFQSSDGAMWFSSSGQFGSTEVTSFRRPTQALVQTKIFRAPPALLGDSRFFFEGQGFEIGSDRQPPISFAITRSVDQPEGSDWSSFRLKTGFEVTGLDNGTWTLHVRAKDRYGNIDPTPATATFTVDLTPPTVVISSPRGIVHGRVEITGLAFDNSAIPDLKSYRLEYGKGVSENLVSSWSQDRIQNLSTEPVVNGVLGRWDTEGLTGPYVLRLTAEDSLNHRSQYAVTVNVVTAAEELDPRLGGHVRDSGAKVDLYIPPKGLERSTQVTIAAVDEGEIQLPAEGQQQFMGLAFHLQPDTLKLDRPATLRLFLGEEGRGTSPDPLALFLWSEGEARWVRVGGTFDEESHSVSAAIGRLGTYALFAAKIEEGNGPELSALACQPRMISPQGGGFAEEMEISFALGRSTEVAVRVFDTAGHLVRELMEAEALLPGSNVVRWDGRDEEGRLVYDGAYVVVVEIGDTARREVVAVVNGQR